MKKIVLAGGTGHLGTLLKKALLKAGWDVVILSRQKNNQEDGATYVVWDGQHVGEWQRVLEEADALINLSGKSIQCRFTSENRAILERSRIVPTMVLGEAISKCEKAPRLWINFSGISIFSGLKAEQDEASIAVGTGYLAQLARKWEAAFAECDLSKTTKVILRLSPVLAKDKGMFAELLPIARYGMGGTVADGKQYISWIHQQDFVALVLWILVQPEPRRVYHACSPYPVTNERFMRVLRESLGISFGLPLPRLMAKIGSFVKNVDSSMLLDSVRGTTSYTIGDGFLFQFDNIRDACADLVQ